jgi:hypothetical protein
MSVLAISLARFSTLCDRGHSEGTRSRQPVLVPRSAMQLKEGIAIAGGAMAEVRAFGQPARTPRELVTRLFGAI